jgi:hypothetical protein
LDLAVLGLFKKHYGNTQRPEVKSQLEGNCCVRCRHGTALRIVNVLMLDSTLERLTLNSEAAVKGLGF